jgi:hypothetical protein
MAKTRIITLLSIVLVMLSACFNEGNSFSNAKKLTLNKPCLAVENKCEILLINDNDNIKIHLYFKAPPSYQRLLPITLESSNTKLNNISISMIIDDKEMPPEKMKLSENKTLWEAQLLPFATVTKDNLKLRLIVSYKSELYFAEFAVLY